MSWQRTNIKLTVIPLLAKAYFPWLITKMLEDMGGNLIASKKQVAIQLTIICNRLSVPTAGSASVDPFPSINGNRWLKDVMGFVTASSFDITVLPIIRAMMVITRPIAGC